MTSGLNPENRIDSKTVILKEKNTFQPQAVSKKDDVNQNKDQRP